MFTNIYIITLDINRYMMKMYKSILVHSFRGKQLYQHSPHKLYSLSNSPYPEPLRWLLSLEGDARHLHFLLMKQNEGEWIHSNN